MSSGSDWAELLGTDRFSDDIKRDKERLTAIIVELALKAGRGGVSAGDVRVTAEARGVLTGQENEARMRALNLGALMKKAGLFQTDRYRPSPIKRAHHNPNRIYVVREFAEVA